MSFTMGNYPQSNVSEKILKSMNHNYARVFGVAFNTSGTDGRQWGGGRLYNSVGLRFVPTALNSSGTSFTAGLDEFKRYVPFSERVCALKYDESSDKQIVLGYQDELSEDDWSTLISPEDVNVMVEFPKFWYCRPARYEFLVSDTPIEGFLPSPMHWRNGVLYDFVYISKYRLSFNGDMSAYISKSGKRGIYQYWNENVSSSANGFGTASSTVCTVQIHREKLRPYKWYIMDYASYASLLMLGLIKYATTNFCGYVGAGNISSKTSSSGVISTGSMDNCPTFDGGTPVNVLKDKNGYNSVISLGLENLWGNTEVAIEGILQVAYYLYINTDIENIANWPDSSLGGWTKVSTPIPSNSHTTTAAYYIGSMVYPSDFSIALWAYGSTTTLAKSKVPNSDQSIIAGTTASPTALFAGGGCNSWLCMGPFSMSLLSNTLAMYYNSIRGIAFRKD